METYITVCKMDGQWEFAIWLKELRPGLGDNLEGWDGEGRGGMLRWEGTWVPLWLMHADVR